MVLEVVGRAGANHIIEGLAKPPREIAARLFRNRRNERRSLGGINASFGCLLEQRLAHAAPLADEVLEVQPQKRQAHAEHRRFDVFDPVAGEVADHERVGDHAAVDHREKCERHRAAPEQGRPHQLSGKGVELRHRRAPEAVQGMQRGRGWATRSFLSIVMSCPAD